MKSIQRQLEKIRKAALIHDFQVMVWIGYAFFLFIIISAIALESIFYFNTTVRFFIWQLGLVAFVLILLIVMLFILLALKNRIRRYQWLTLARKTGEISFPKADTVINAFQLEKGLQDSSSKDLSQQFIDETIQQLDSLNIRDIFLSNSKRYWKILSLVILFMGLSIFAFRFDENAQAVYRWSHPHTQFPAPKPFDIQCTSGDIELLGGENADLVFHVAGNKPDSLFIDLVGLVYRDSTEHHFAAKMDSSGRFIYHMDDVTQDYLYRAYVPARHFWEPWDEVSSAQYTITVTDRPMMEDLTITITPPLYTKLPMNVQKGNQAEISGIFGSTVGVILHSNRSLQTAALSINENIIPMNINNNRAEGNFLLKNDGQLSILLTDHRGIANKNPIPFYVTVIPDLLPDITVYQPDRIFDLGNNLTIPVHIHIEDDFGFSQLQIVYEVHRPEYIDSDPVLSFLTIPIAEPQKISQDLIHLWLLEELQLMPEDELHFHFELDDNDIVSGPKKSITGEFIARLPGLAELFTQFENKEEEILNDVSMSMDDLNTVKQKMDEMKLDILKQEKMTWDQQQDLQKMVDNIKSELQKLEEVAAAMQSLENSAEKHDLFSSALLEKFNHLQELVQELFSEKFMDKLQQLDQLLQEMNPQKLKEALQSMAEQMDKVERELDRFIDIFERIRAEQKLDELRTRLEQLVDQQQLLNEKIENIADHADASEYSRLSAEEQRQSEQLSGIRNEMEKSAEIIEQFHPQSAEKLADLQQNPMMNQAQNDLQNAANQLKRHYKEQSYRHSQDALDHLQQLLSEMQQIQQGFQQATTGEMAAKLQQNLANILNLSKAQEQLQNETQAVSSNSLQLGDFAGRQQTLQDQLHQIMENLMDLSGETFAITPEIGKKIGMANAQMQESIRSLAERNGSGARNQQQQALKALNESAMAIFQSMNQMQSSGSASGYEQFLQQMQNMAGQQQGINDQSMQLALGQMAASAQQGLLQNLLAQQNSVRKSLKQLMEEMQRSGKQGLGDMKGIAEEMDQVLNDMQKKQITRKTIDRQQKILSRMLDSQKSLTQQGEKEEFKSETGKEFTLPGVSGLPDDLGQRKSLTTEAMNRAIKAGYSREYQNMIRRYFNAIGEKNVFISSDSAHAN